MKTRPLCKTAKNAFLRRWKNTHEYKRTKGMLPFHDEQKIMKTKKNHEDEQKIIKTNPKKIISKKSQMY